MGIFKNNKASDDDASPKGLIARADSMLAMASKGLMMFYLATASTMLATGAGLMAVSSRIDRSLAVVIGAADIGAVWFLHGKKSEVDHIITKLRRIVGGGTPAVVSESKKDDNPHNDVSVSKPQSRVQFIRDLIEKAIDTGLISVATSCAIAPAASAVAGLLFSATHHDTTAKLCYTVTAATTAGVIGLYYSVKQFALKQVDKALSVIDRGSKASDDQKPLKEREMYVARTE